MAVNDGDILEVTVIHEIAFVGDVVNRYQFEHGCVTPQSDEAVLDNVAELIETIYTIVQSIINIRNVLREVGVFNKTQNRVVGITDAGTYTGGTAADPAIQSGVAPVATFKTNVPKVILRKFLPPLSTSKVGTGGNLTTATQTTVEAYAALLLSPFGINASTFQYGHLSPKTLTFVVPEIAVVSPIQGYQRRRKQGVGS